MTNTCPACERGTLERRVSNRIIQFEGQALKVANLHYSECPICAEKVVLPAQSKLNEVAYADAKKGALDLWSCGKIEAFRKEWGLTQSVAAKLFGGGANAFSKYERGEVIHNRSMDLLMKVFEQSEDARVLITDIAGVSLPTVPRWETVTSDPGPKRSASANAVLRTYAVVKHLAANNDRWKNSEVAHGG